MHIADDTSYPPPGAGDIPDDMFKKIVDGSAAPFAVIEYDGTVRYASGSITVFGWKPADVAGRNIAEFLDEDQIDLAAEAIAEYRDRENTEHGVPVMFKLRRRDGSTGWVEVGGSPFTDTDGVDLIILRCGRGMRSSTLAASSSPSRAQPRSRRSSPPSRSFSPPPWKGSARPCTTASTGRASPAACRRGATIPPCPPEQVPGSRWRAARSPPTSRATTCRRDPPGRSAAGWCPCLEPTPYRRRC